MSNQQSQDQLTRNKEYRYHYDKHGDTHKPEWEAPPEFDIAVANSEVDPVGDEDTQKVGDEHQGES